METIVAGGAEIALTMTEFQANVMPPPSCPQCAVHGHLGVGLPCRSFADKPRR